MMFLIDTYYWDNITKQHEKHKSTNFINPNFIEQITIPDEGDFATIMGAGKENYSSYLVKKERAIEIIQILEELKEIKNE